ncbi:N-terminal cleavage protein [Opitutaceae bacterium TAV5]|nr:N-terminal cleavage protein [Opitutaceae bacterium TAV5]
MQKTLQSARSTGYEHGVPARFQARSAFTLVELLVVIAVIGILAAILVPTAAKVRKTARSTQCLSNLRQISMAAILFANDRKGKLPDGIEPGETGVKWAVIMRYQLIDTLPRNAGKDVWFCPGQPVVISAYFYPNVKSYGATLAEIPHPARFILWRDRAENPAVNADTEGTPGSYGPHDMAFNACFADGHSSRIRDRSTLVELLQSPEK